jgi:septal ring factor EnvC (AmiA/AmiB activator)
MELELALAASVIAVVALWLALSARNRLGGVAAELTSVRTQLQQVRAELDQVRQTRDRAEHALEQLRSEQAQTRREVAQAQRDVADVKTAIDMVPAPPLPKARSAGLDDLRERLRAAHREPDSDTDTVASSDEPGP